MIALTRLHILAAGIALAVLQAGCATEPGPAATAASPCKPWVNYPADSHGNQGSPYLGCTNRANLEAMVDNKGDLAKGQKLGPANGATQSDAVKSYEAGKVKTKSQGSTGGFGILLPKSSNMGGSQ